MTRPKSIIFLGDGMADEPIEALGGKTPLQAAHTPNMDQIAKMGCSGTLFTLPDEFPTSSDVANMSVLGCDLETEYCGRGPLEAAGQGIQLGPEDVAFRLNLIHHRKGILDDYSAGQLDPSVAEDIIDALNIRLGNDQIRFYPGLGFRSILVLSGPEFTHDIMTEKPDDNMGNRISDHYPKAKGPGSESTAGLLRDLIQKADDFLPNVTANVVLAGGGKKTANGIWPWNGGKIRKVRTLAERYHGATGAVISAVDVVKGLGVLLGMDVIPVEGATGYIDTNWEGKADAAIEALKTHDLVYLHVEGIDEVSHEQSLEKKLKGIELFDARCMGRVMAAIGPDVRMAVLPDHPVPLSIGKHTRTPVPVSIYIPGREADQVTAYSESDALKGSIGQLEKDGLMQLLMT
jgi:2,3-bisphosphoglycerate-independent phosphoglycerate mutase